MPDEHVLEKPTVRLVSLAIAVTSEYGKPPGPVEKMTSPTASSVVKCVFTPVIVVVPLQEIVPEPLAAKFAERLTVVLFETINCPIVSVGTFVTSSVPPFWNSRMSLGDASGRFGLQFCELSKLLPSPVADPVHEYVATSVVASFGFDGAPGRVVR